MTLLPKPDAETSAPTSPPIDAGEAELIRDIQAGNTRAFEKLVHLHSRRVFNFIHQMTRQRQDAEDLVQQTFVKAYHNIHRFSAERPFINWLLTIARRTALNHFRSAKKWEEISETNACPAPSPASQVEHADRTENLWARARRVLNQREFEVLWLRFAEELSVEETSRVTGLTQVNVKVLVHRARQQLLKGESPL